MTKLPQPKTTTPAGIALAVTAHPDDIEFLMAGTLLLLRQAGWEIHCLNVATGNCGSSQYNAAQTRAIRRREAQEAARRLGAHWHPSLTDDIEIFYEDRLLRRLAAAVRDVRPDIVLTHSPQDYMEDHVNAGRLAVTASFVRGMPNYRTVPRRAAIPGDVTLYHAMPHGLRDGLRRLIIPGAYVDTTEVQSAKRHALAAHSSQKTWLDSSQGMDSYLDAMDQMARSVGKMSRRFAFAEGWRRHSHLGFCAEQADPLQAALGKRYLANPAYERALNCA
ncbi:MAG: PIG-L family deacetylase [Verrucomicrobia bacterium]|jgi:LmbE family N-acetylglucosaminyl deacetylase|nr:PIG-L family deacetylase [Verrucomicrobiota bacterium]OQC65382.1 MAG: 4-oxalmesaconate hydratase [Verrucomicrobia bacterium ADurb.Bin006]MDI9380129.1 PIG-L family deacetylase [Verrucomicrobiota bacterium]NMD20580.1 LmbE family protein [Verrucomicrobiota bacterium]HNV00007.1 PIG-L family deacetylase [Verrucomicrobiota bacterium]